MIARTTFSEATTGVDMSPGSRSRQETGSPSPERRSAVTDSAPYAPPLASKEARTRTRRAALGSGLDALAAWSR